MGRKKHFIKRYHFFPWKEREIQKRHLKATVEKMSDVIVRSKIEISFGKKKQPRITDLGKTNSETTDSGVRYRHEWERQGHDRKGEGQND